MKADKPRTTLPPEMLPRVLGAEIAIVCPSCNRKRIWGPKDGGCPSCGRRVDETVQ